MKKSLALLVIIPLLLASCAIAHAPSAPSHQVSSAPLPSSSAAMSPPPASLQPVKLTSIYFPPADLSGADRLLDMISHDSQTNTACGFAPDVTLHELIASYDALGMQPTSASFTVDGQFLSKYKSRFHYVYDGSFKSIQIDLMPPVRDESEHQSLKAELLKRFTDEYGSYRMIPGAPVEEWYAWDVPGFDVFLIFNSADFTEKGILATVSIWPPYPEKYAGAPLPPMFSFLPDPGDPLCFYRHRAPGLDPACQYISYTFDDVYVNYSFEKDVLDGYSYGAVLPCEDYRSSIDFCEALADGLVKLWGKPDTRRYDYSEEGSVSSGKKMKALRSISDYGFTVNWPGVMFGTGQSKGFTELDVSWSSGTLEIHLY